MADFLSQYSIQRWLEACPQGYLDGTVFGHAADAREPDDFMENELLREGSNRHDRCSWWSANDAALAASSAS